MWEQNKENNYALEVSNLSKKYRDFSLENVSFKIPTGSIMGFVGENGAGKTTTIKSIMGVRKSDGGSVSIFGQKSGVYSKNMHNDIGIVLDDCAFAQVLRPKDISASMKRVFSKWDESQFFSYLKKFGLPADKKLKDFSRGMKMKLSIAVAMSHDAKLLIMDEPTGGLDPVVRDEILDLFMEFMQDESHTILLSSHILSDIERIADYVTFIHNGRVVFSESREDLADKYILVHCANDEVSKIDNNLIAGVRTSRFGSEVLINDKHAFLNNSYGMETDKATLEDIMLFTIKGEAGMFREE